MNPCNLCPRKCNIDRSQKIGFCGESEALSIARIAPHFFEEPPISYKKGSGTVFFTGCNLRCEFCQNKAISRGNAEGKIYTKNELIDALCSLQENGVHNINLVTPTHFADKIADILSDMRSRGLLKVPTVYNTSGYESVETLRMLDGLIDIYMPDLKYFSSELSARYSGAGDYFKIASAAISEMLSQVGEPLFKEGLIKRGVIVRHLVLPGCRKDSMNVLEALSRLVPPDKIKLSLMRQFTPDFVDREKYPELCRKVTTFEYDSVVKRAGELGFDGYIQSTESASAEYTPMFNCQEAFQTV